MLHLLLCTCIVVVNSRTRFVYIPTTLVYIGLMTIMWFCCGDSTKKSGYVSYNQQCYLYQPQQTRNASSKRLYEKRLNAKTSQIITTRSTEAAGPIRHTQLEPLETIPDEVDNHPLMVRASYVLHAVVLLDGK